MKPHRRFFTFSLRTFFVLLTIGCLWLGRIVEKARSRGAAIDAIVAAKGIVGYGDNGDDLILGPFNPPADHFWSDAKGVPVMIGIDAPLDATIGAQLAQVHNVSRIEIGSKLTDADLQYLESIQGACELVLYQAEALSDAALEKLQEKVPHAEITWARAGQ